MKTAEVNEWFIKKREELIRAVESRPLLFHEPVKLSGRKEAKAFSILFPP